MSSAPSRSSAQPRIRRLAALYQGFVAWTSTLISDLATSPAITWQTGAPTHTDVERSLYWRLDADSWSELLYRHVSGTSWESLGDGALSALGERYNLRWTAGQRGKPGLNADINSATEAVREIADPDFELLGTNATSGSATFFAEGGITLTTAGASADQVILLPHLDANQSAWTQVTWGTDKQTVWECDISTAASIADCIIWAGLKLTNTPTVATDNDQVFIRYEAGVNDGEFQVISSIGGTDTTTDSGVVVAVSTRYRLRIAIGADRTARIYINGALIYTTAALTDATDLKPYIGVQSSAVAAKSIRVYGQAISRTIG